MQDTGRSVDPDFVGAQGPKASGAKPEMVGGSTAPTGTGTRMRAKGDALRDISKAKNADLDNFIATNNEDYINKAVFYANNINKLENIRKDLFDKILETPLFDTKKFSNDFCEALENMQKIINRD